MELRTPRLMLRSWRDQDLPPFAALNADPAVRRWFPSVLTHAESDAQAARLRLHDEEHGYTFWAVEVPGVAPFVGFVGLFMVRFEAPFTPAVEIGWRLAQAYWGRGYATEAAEAALAHAYGPLGPDEVVAFTVPGNSASRRLMEKIGMRHDPADDFDHPDLPEGHAMRRHVLYRATRPSLPLPADRPTAVPLPRAVP